MLLITGISLTPYVELGLDQSIALPQDSYLIPYFVDQATLLKVGAPVYFVIGGNNVTTHATQAQHCASFGNCTDLSVPTTIVLESQRPEYSTIAMRPSLWIDDYITWLNPNIPYTRWYASRRGGRVGASVVSISLMMRVGRRRACVRRCLYFAAAACAKTRAARLSITARLTKRTTHATRVTPPMIMQVSPASARPVRSWHRRHDGGGAHSHCSRAGRCMLARV